MGRFLRSGILAPAVLLLSAAGALADTVWDLVNQVNQAQYTAYLRDSLYTRAGNNRNDGQPDHAAAQAFIFNTLTGFGLTTVLDSSSHAGYPYTNVVATLPGSLYPDRIYVVGAHYDSVSCPGGDDNASGVAGVLEAARVLSQYDFESTIVFIAFDREEDGLHGSYGYAAAHAADNILGMISMDMIAFNHVASAYYNKAWVTRATGSASPTVRDALAQALFDYTAITPVTGNMGSSDHVPFAARGDGSALLIEYAMSANANPYYHQLGDYTADGGGNPQTWTYLGTTYDYIDYAYATDMTRGVVGYLATVAGLYQQAAVVPEPASVWLLAGGAAAVLVVVRRRRVRAHSAQCA